MVKVTAIIPAYNEEKHVGNVLSILTTSPDVDEVIAINDGSTDSTLAKMKNVPRVKIIDLKENHGKAYGIVRGTQEATGDIILFVDADLTGLHHDSIHALVAPLKSYEYDIAVGYRGADKLSKRLFLPIGGERAYFKKDLVPYLADLQNRGYGLELYLNYTFRGKRVKVVALRNVNHTMKYEKVSLLEAAIVQLTEIFDLLKIIIYRKNPLHFFLYAYMYPFYLKPRTWWFHRITNK